jgi:hypothetical protein
VQIDAAWAGLYIPTDPMSKVDRKLVLSDLREEYLNLLTPLFSQHERVDTTEYVLALIRAGGMQDAGWDPLEESRAFVNDLAGLIQSDDPAGRFTDPETTSWRLALVAYAHLVEMDAPYDMLANLFRVGARRKYSVQPFAEPSPKKAKTWKLNGPPPPGPSKKLPKLHELAASCGMSAVTDAFNAFYSGPLRNAISHSDFVLHGKAFRARKSYFEDAPGSRVFAPSIELDRLQEILSRTFCFYSAFLELELRARLAFRQLKGHTFRYDQHYKGILELLFDDELICGLTIHWPNGTSSRMRRGSDGCEATNILFGREGSIEPMVGLYAQHPGEYSPLVERGAEPVYQQTESGAAITWDGARIPTATGS